MAQMIGDRDLGKHSTTNGSGANLNGVAKNGSHTREAAQKSPPVKQRTPEKTPAKAKAAKNGHAHTVAKTTKKPAGKLRGLGIDRHYTAAGVDPLDEITWERRTSVITNTDGSV